jgi:two-component system sensor histidine kinase HydH
MAFLRKIHRSGRLQTSPWLIIGSTVILLVVVVILAYQNYNREKQYMSRILSEKGAALIRAVEAGARTGMRRMMWGGDLVQVLLEETARMQGVLYMALVDKDGRVAAHSDQSRVGEQMTVPLPSGDFDVERWRTVDIADRPKAFEVYRFFKPVHPAGPSSPERMRPMMRRHSRMMDRWERRGPDKAHPPEQVIIAGLDIRPFEEASRVDIRNTAVISAVLILLGFGGFVSMFWAQNYRNTRRSLQDTSAFADEVVAHLPVGLIATDSEGNIAFFNDAAEKITGIRFDQVRGKSPEAVLPSQWRSIKAAVDRGRTIDEKEMACAFSEQRVVPVSLSATRIVSEEDRMVGHVIILRDLGEIRRLQEEIRRKEKLAAIGGLAAGVAHEIRNPLSSIKGIATYFGRKFESDSDDRQVTEVMIQEAERLNRVITELLEFARPTKLNLQSTDVNALIHHSLRLVRQDAHTRRIDIKMELEAPEYPVVIDPDRFSQCLLNLYLNAMQAMSSGGVLTVGSAARNGHLIVEVSDTGGGMPPEQLHQIFDPYFTTKSTGTGLGLAVVHKIIEAHGGKIRVKSRPGQGTTFTLVIPETGPDESQDRPASPQPSQENQP